MRCPEKYVIMFINIQLCTLQASFFGQTHYFVRIYKCSIINIIKYIAFRILYTPRGKSIIVIWILQLFHFG